MTELCRDLTEILINDNNPQLLSRPHQLHNHQLLLCNVDFSKGSPKADAMETSYVIDYLNARESKNADDIWFIFPNIGDVHKQALRACSYSSLDDLNLEINARILQSAAVRNEDDWTCRLMVAYGDHVFMCNGFIGTMYLIRADRIVRDTRDGVEIQSQNNVSLLFNMVGPDRPRSIFILKPRVASASDLALMPIYGGGDRASPRQITPKKSLWVAEIASRTVGHKQRNVLISREHAWKIACQPTRNDPLQAYAVNNVLDQSLAVLDALVEEEDSVRSDVELYFDTHSIDREVITIVTLPKNSIERSPFESDLSEEEELL